MKTLSIFRTEEGIIIKRKNELNARFKSVFETEDEMLEHMDVVKNLGMLDEYELNVSPEFFSKVINQVNKEHNEKIIEQGGTCKCKDCIKKYWSEPVIQIQHFDYNDWETMLWTNRNVWEIVFEALKQHYNAESYRVLNEHGEVLKV